MLNIITELQKHCNAKDLIETLQYLAEKYQHKIVFSTSFGYEDQVMTDIIFSNKIPIKIFTLDTGRFFPETYKVWQRTCEKYNQDIISYFPDATAVEKMMKEKGPFSFYASVENRKECCHIRKVEPLNRALQGVECWITGLRSEQSVARKNLSLFEWDEVNKLIKVNPLHNWNLLDVKNYINQNNVPINRLHDEGFVSIGCQPCTRAIIDGEDFRAGRWWWEDNSKKECGLHFNYELGITNYEKANS